MASSPRDFTLALGAYSIRVRYLPEIIEDGDECDGLWCPAEKEIRLKDSLPPKEEIETLLHEVVEAINTLYDLELTHQTITTLGMGLLQALAGKLHLGEL
jgi:hypothetical protein